MKLTHVSKSLLAGAALVSMLGLTACGPDDDGASSSKGGGTSAESSEGGTSDGGGDSSDGGQDTDGGGGANGNGAQGAGQEGEAETAGASGSSSGSGDGAQLEKCRTDRLSVSAVDNSAGADDGEGVVTVVFKNDGGKKCIVNGYPGADLKTADGSSLSLERNGDKPVPGVLEDGDSAAFNIYFPANDSGGSGVRPTKIVVTPPNETKSVVVAWPAGSLPVSDGSGGGTALEISPVGTVSDSPAG